MLRIIFLIALLSGCASKRDYLGNGKKLFENGMYSEALKEFELGVKTEPNNVDLVIGLRKAQDKIYEVELLKIRDTRAAGDPYKAIEKVREIDAKMKGWNIQTNISGSQFRKSELDRIMADIKRLLADDLRQGKILKAHQELKKNQDILGPLDSYQSFEGEIIQGGKEKCQSMQGDYKFFNIFISKYCEYFSVQHQTVISIEDELYDVTKVKLVVDGKEVMFYNFLVGSRLFHPQAKTKLRSESNVSFKYNEKKSTQKKIHSYPGEEAYTAYESQKYWVDEPYYSPVVRCNYQVVPASCYTENVRSVRQVAKYKDVKVRKHRKVTKTYDYKVDVIDQSLKLSGSSLLHMAGKKIRIPHDMTESHSDYGHNHNYSDMQLYPKKIILKNQLDWQRSMIARVAGSLRTEVELRWVHNYCRKEGDSKLQGEYMMRCAFVAADSNPFLNEWSTNFTGLPYPEMKKLLKI